MFNVHQCILMLEKRCSLQSLHLLALDVSLFTMFNFISKSCGQLLLNLINLHFFLPKALKHESSHIFFVRGISGRHVALAQAPPWARCHFRGEGIRGFGRTCFPLRSENNEPARLHRTLSRTFNWFCCFLNARWPRTRSIIQRKMRRWDMVRQWIRFLWVNQEKKNRKTNTTQERAAKAEQRHTILQFCWGEGIAKVSYGELEIINEKNWPCIGVQKVLSQPTHSACCDWVWHICRVYWTGVTSCLD